ncbi:LruC domain-containing protein [Pseudomonadales bacterium]|nr:LruC domain-containing protein [Pseudomonadales bacterium]
MQIEIENVQSAFKVWGCSHKAPISAMPHIGVVGTAIELMIPEYKQQTRRSHMFRFFSLLAVAALCSPAFGSSFTACPNEAFLVQDQPAKLYGVDLSTGSYTQLAEDMGTVGKLNAISFNFHDRFLYAWDYEDDSIARIGTDYQVELLPIKNRPNSDFYVGDIALEENTYYVYRRGSANHHGLFRISLDPNSADYLEAIRISNGQNLRYNIYDFAFHPDNNLLYSVASNGLLIEMSPETGATRELGKTGLNGTFGAIYFDVEGNLYASRNKDGLIFRLNPLASDVTAVEFAQGPSSSNNDGARCAYAPVVINEASKADFGDAPDTYGTSLGENGPRHGDTNNSLFLGAIVDRENQAYLSPESDDAVGEADEDGISFVTTLEAGKPAIIQVQVQGEGYLNGWIDFNQNGRFDDSEQITRDQSVTTGTHNLIIDVPSTLVAGNTWSRFRLSSNTGVGANGGVPDGEVEDHEVLLSSSTDTTVYYPSVKGFVTLAFEDLWPSVGDYDMNDLVVHYRTATQISGDTVTGVNLSGQMLAIGATFHNGFAIDLPGVPREAVDQSSIEFVINGVTQKVNPLEEGQTNAVFVVTQDIWNHVSPAEACSFYRTESNCGDSNVQASYSITFRFNTPQPLALFEDRLFNPFIFATEGFERNSIFSEPPGRKLEIHLKNKKPTDLADPALLGRADDFSNPDSENYYQNANGLPWAVEIGTEWKHPGEYIDLIEAYPDFSNWVTSKGKSHQNWYLLEKAVKPKLYREGKD